MRTLNEAPPHNDPDDASEACDALWVIALCTIVALFKIIALWH